MGLGLLALLVLGRLVLRPMRRVTYIVAIGTLAAAVAGCTDPYAPRYSQGYSSPSGYGYPASYGYQANSSYPSGSYYSNRYGYGSGGDYNYNRNYSATRSPQVTFTLP